MHIDIYSTCDTCGLLLHVIGEVTPVLYMELSKLYPCPRCPGETSWLQETPTLPARTVTPDKYYAVCKGGESIDERLPPEAIAAMLCTYRISRVQMQGDGIQALELENGLILELGISRYGPYVTRTVRKEE